MENIIIYPKNERQKSLLKSLLEEMKVRFEVEKASSDSLMSQKDYFAKIDKAIHQSETGVTKKLSKENQKQFLGL